jgi:hypothetical protein
MLRWELPTGIRRRGESIFLTLYRCIEQESSSQFAVRIGRAVCLGLNSSRQHGLRYFAMFFECKSEVTAIKLVNGVERRTNLTEDVSQQVVGASFIDWRRLAPTDMHPQHREILSRWSQAPEGPLFAVVSDADSELAFYNKMGTVASRVLDASAAPAEQAPDENTTEWSCPSHRQYLPPAKTTVLFLAANPDGVTKLALDQECRAIREKIRASDFPNA